MQALEKKENTRSCEHEDGERTRQDRGMTGRFHPASFYAFNQGRVDKPFLGLFWNRDLVDQLREGDVEMMLGVQSGRGFGDGARGLERRSHRTITRRGVVNRRAFQKVAFSHRQQALHQRSVTVFSQA